MTELEYVQDTLPAHFRTLLRRLPPLGAWPSDEEGDLTNLAHYYRLRAIAGFLETGETTPYLADLHRAGQTRLYYLRGCEQGATGTPRFWRTSRNRAFFDCLAINDLETAEELARLCDERWVDALEYEDDFLFPQFLQRFFLELRAPRPTGTLPALLARFARVIGEEGSPFHSLCLALHAGHTDRFESSLEAIVQRRAGNYARAAHFNDLPPLILHTERYIDVQAVAIIRLAQESGLALSRLEYPRVPGELCELARSRQTFPPLHSWRVLTTP
ncbi:immunity 49 family protein [Myxococcus sp. CA051A]|uniref:immunity 49 family protein n=1 Tax=Myxococcus sp. CA051A TaxID=2741739 RepID=UPI00157A3629|nr:immunity 49 family protein [Myxococcus sp. CA051A]NTX60211.1 immunity 49 family protein [Myxococcus sp. CA051A]